ncbi:MAG: hypothetical protein AB7T49_19460 [Oligoflexales bacterium]
MRYHHFAKAVLVLLVVTAACKKEEEKKGKASASLMKSETVSVSLHSQDGNDLVAETGSYVQSFTPESLTIPIFKVSLCAGGDTWSCRSIYLCEDNTYEGCAVELSDIDAFVNAINSSPTELEAGKTFDYIGVEFCKEDQRDGIQHIVVKGTVDIQGTTYATDPTAGLVEGTEGEATDIEVEGGCASYYPLSSPVTIAEDVEVKAQIFFDASMAVYGGVAGGAENTRSYNDTGGCVGDEDAYVCAPVVTVVSTVDSGEPEAEHYLLANIDSSADNAPTASAVLYFNSDGEPIGGVQNTYRLSGPTVVWGDVSMGGGLGLAVTEVDDNAVTFGEPDENRQLVDWFKEFKREDHTGTYTFDNRGEEAEGTYKATKF